MSPVRRSARSNWPLLPATQRLHQLTNDTSATLALLRAGRLEIVGRLTDASNATFVCRLLDVGDTESTVVYKPIRGERPLDDFPRATLSNREVAAFALSESTGWDVVPPTIGRDGPFGPGMVQLWIEVDPAADVLEMIIAGDPRLRRVAIFDILANNADRKGGHLLPAPDGHIYGVDHGICFAAEPKLRTVLWGWRGTELEQDERDVLRTVLDLLGDSGPLTSELGALLHQNEVRATRRRAAALLRSGRFPEPDPNRPAVPWPPF